MIDMYLVGFFSVACIVVPLGGMLFLFLNREAVREIEAEGSDDEEERKVSKKRACIKSVADLYSGFDAR